MLAIFGGHHLVRCFDQVDGVAGLYWKQRSCTYVERHNGLLEAPRPHENFPPAIYVATNSYT